MPNSERIGSPRHRPSSLTFTVPLTAATSSTLRSFAFLAVAALGRIKREVRFGKKGRKRNTRNDQRLQVRRGRSKGLKRWAVPGSFAFVSSRFGGVPRLACESRRGRRRPRGRRGGERKMDRERKRGEGQRDWMRLSRSLRYN